MTSPANPSSKTRFVFWRGPDSRPVHDGNHAPTEVLAQWGRETRINSSGRPEWTGFRWLELELAIKYSFVILDRNKRELNEVDAWAIARSALYQLAIEGKGNKPIKVPDFLAVADSLAEIFMKKTRQRYVLVTSLSVPSFPKNRFKIGDCWITGLASRKRYPVPAILHDPSTAEYLRNHAGKTRYRWIKISCQGRSEEEAVREALDAIGLARAIWNLVALYQQTAIRVGNSEPDPLAAIQTGPVHSLHREAGEPVDDGAFWFEAEPVFDRPLRAIDWTRLESERKRIMKRMRSLPYQAELGSLLLRYGRALDQSDHGVGFLQMWGVIEKITGTVGGKYDETVERATWIYRQVERRLLSRRILTSIRIQRNRYVHAAQPPPQSDQAAYLAKSFLEPLFNALIFNHYRVRSLEEFIEVLSLSADTGSLRKQKKHIDLALSVHGPIKAMRKSKPTTPSAPQTAVSPVASP